MSVTMIAMDLIKVDVLTPYSIEPGDLIGIAGDVVTITNVEALSDGYTLEYVNDFGEEESLHCADDAKFYLYIEE